MTSPRSDTDTLEATPAGPYDGRSALAVDDTYGTVHLAYPGRGILCDQVRLDVSRNPISWTYDSVSADCDSCWERA